MYVGMLVSQPLEYALERDLNLSKPLGVGQGRGGVSS